MADGDADFDQLRYKHLLEPLRDAAENWGVDISAELDEYLGELDTLAKGVNFRQAGMLVFGSSQVYSRKVEYLKTLVYQRMDLFIRLKNKRNRTASSINEEGRDLDAVFDNEGEPTLLTLDWPTEQSQVAVNVDDSDYAPYQSLRRAQLQAQPPVSLLSLDPVRLLPNAKVPSSGFKIANLAVHSSGALLLQERDRFVADPVHRMRAAGLDLPFGSPTLVLRARHLGNMMLDRIGANKITVIPATTSAAAAAAAAGEGERVQRQLPFDEEGLDDTLAGPGAMAELPAPDFTIGDDDDDMGGGLDFGAADNDEDDDQAAAAGAGSSVTDFGEGGLYAGPDAMAAVQFATGISPALAVATATGAGAGAGAEPGAAMGDDENGAVAAAAAAAAVVSPAAAGAGADGGDDEGIWDTYAPHAPLPSAAALVKPYRGGSQLLRPIVAPTLTPVAFAASIAAECASSVMSLTSRAGATAVADSLALAAVAKKSTRATAAPDLAFGCTDAVAMRIKAAREHRRERAAGGERRGKHARRPAMPATRASAARAGDDGDDANASATADGAGAGADTSNGGDQGAGALDDLDASAIAPAASSDGAASSANAAAGVGLAEDSFGFDAAALDLLPEIPGADDDDDDAVAPGSAVASGLLAELSAAASAGAGETAAEKRNLWETPVRDAAAAAAAAEGRDEVWSGVNLDRFTDSTGKRGLTAADAQALMASAPSYEALCRKYVESYLVLSDQFAGETRLSKRVRQWETKLEPVLAAETERTPFDIYDYGTGVMQSITKGAPVHTASQSILVTAESSSPDDGRASVKTDPEDSKSVLSLADTLRGKPQWEVCRTFLAALQLANSGNIAIVPTPDGYSPNGPDPAISPDAPAPAAAADSSANAAEDAGSAAGRSMRSAGAPTHSSCSPNAPNGTITGERTLFAPGAVCFKLISARGRVREDIEASVTSALPPAPSATAAGAAGRNKKRGRDAAGASSDADALGALVRLTQGHISDSDDDGTAPSASDDDDDDAGRGSKGKGSGAGRGRAKAGRGQLDGDTDDDDDDDVNDIETLIEKERREKKKEQASRSPRKNRKRSMALADDDGDSD